MNRRGKLLILGLTLVLVSFQSGRCGEAESIQQKEGTGMQVNVRWKVNIEPKPDSIAISYEFVNTLDQPVLVFDRMWDRQKQALDPDWANVEIRGSKALISRSLRKKPKDLHFDNPPVPYGRVVEPGKSIEGKFTVGLPLTETYPYYNFVHPQGDWADIPVTDVAFALGWGVKPANLPPAIKPVDVGEDKGMLLLPYGSIEQIEKLLISEPIRARIVGRGKR